MSVFRGLFVRGDATRGTQPAEARLSLAGLLTPSSNLGAMEGILPAPSSPLVVSGTAGWTYNVSAGHVVTSRSDTDGAVLFGNDGTVATSAVSAAPGSGSRYDLIYIRHQDIDAGGGETSAAAVGVVEGTAGGSPTKPTASLPAGAVVVAEAQVFSGATSTNHANVTITQVLPNTVARGGILPVANKTALDALTGYEGQRAVLLAAGSGYVQGQEFEWRASGWKWPIAPQRQLGYEKRTTTAGPISTAAPGDLVSSLDFDVTVPDSRLVELVLSGQAIASDATTLAALRIEVAGTTVGQAHTVPSTNGNGSGFTMARRTTLAAGTHSLTVRLARASGAGTVSLDANCELFALDLGAG